MDLNRNKKQVYVYVLRFRSCVPKHCRSISSSKCFGPKLQFTSVDQILVTLGAQQELDKIEGQNTTGSAS